MAKALQVLKGLKRWGQMPQGSEHLYALLKSTGDEGILLLRGMPKALQD